MKKRIAFALVAVLLIIGYLAQPESGPPAGDEAPAAAQETELAEPTMAEVLGKHCECKPGHTDGTVLLSDAGRPSFRTMD